MNEMSNASDVTSEVRVITMSRVDGGQAKNSDG